MPVNENFVVIYLSKLIMPFKTRASKQKASLKWTTLVEGGQAIYSGGSPSLKEDDVSDETQLAKKRQKITQEISQETNIKREIIKIALMALLIIGFQIVLKFSHIGF